MTALAVEVLLEARGISKSFPGVRALRGMHLSIRGGAVSALVGENGAGKSTLMNILSGVLLPDEGEVYVDGECVSIASTRTAQDLGIAIIHQELNLIPDMSIAENIFLGREPKNLLGLIDFDRMNREAAVLLQRLKLDRSPRTPIRNLRVGEQQIVEIAKALSLKARILFMDEPTSALSDAEVEILFGIIDALTAEGAGIVYVTHKMNEVFRICDYVSVLRDGAFIAEMNIKDCTQEKLVELMVGRELDPHARSAAQDFVETALHVEGLSSNGGRPTDFLKEVSLDLKKGEVVGIFGLMGSGRTELFETLFGVHPLSSGTIEIEGQALRLTSPRDAVDAGMGLAPEDRKRDGLVLSMSVRENITLAAVDRITRFGLLSDTLEAGLADDCVSRLHIKTANLSHEIRTLSGGNQQKAVLAKWLTRQPKVLLLDEPTRGIDVNAKREIYGVIRELAREGIGVLFASSELPEVLMLADRILVMSEGRISGEFTAAEANEEELLKAALPATAHNRASGAVPCL